MKVSIEKQSDGSYIAYNNSGEEVTLIGTGDSVREAKEDFFNTIEELRQSYLDTGECVPDFLDDQVDFHFDISSLFEYFSVINVSALGRYLGINPSLMRQYKKGDTYISDAQLEKIEAGIHRLGTELSALKLVWEAQWMISTKHYNAVREGWAEVFAAYAQEGEDSIVMPDFFDSEALGLEKQNPIDIMQDLFAW